MACDRKLKPRQTISERAAEVRRSVAALDSLLAVGKAKAVIDKMTGAVAFAGFEGLVRDGVDDACAYRRLMASGSSLAKAAIARAEQLAGRTVDRQVIGSGMHSHDGGLSFHAKG